MGEEVVTYAEARNEEWNIYTAMRAKDDETMREIKVRINMLGTPPLVLELPKRPLITW